MRAAGVPAWHIDGVRWQFTVAFAVCGPALLVGCAGEALAPSIPAPHIRTFETTAMHIDRIYTSMVGPFERIPIVTSDMAWVTAFRTDVVDAETQEPLGDEFLCHAQIQIPSTVRIVATATGFPEIRLPEGFGIPFGQILGAFPKNERMVTFLGMILNNHEPAIDRWGKVRATVEYYTAEDVGSPSFLKKLYIVGMPITVENLAEYTPPAGSTINDDVTTHCVLVDGQTSHWIVPPGPQTVRERFDDLVAVDSTAHYIAVHMHNYAVYMRLNDVTTGETLWQSDVEYEPERTQIARIPIYSSAEGFPLHRDHAYEVEAHYDNTTDHDVDAMAMMYLYYHPNHDEDIIYPTALQNF